MSSEEGYTEAAPGTPAPQVEQDAPPAETGRRRTGGQPRNRNARRHGFYSRVLDDADRQDLEAAARADGFDEELGILRLKLRQLIEQSPDRVDLQMTAINMIARLVKTRHKLVGGGLSGLGSLW